MPTIAVISSERRDDLHASIIASSYGFLRWLGSQKQPGGPKLAGRGGSAAAALLSEFPDVLNSCAASSSSSLPSGQDIGDLSKDERNSIKNFFDLAVLATSDAPDFVSIRGDEKNEGAPPPNNGNDESLSKRKRGRPGADPVVNKRAFDRVSLIGLSDDAKEAIAAIRAENCKRRRNDVRRMARLEKKIETLKAAKETSVAQAKVVVQQNEHKEKTAKKKMASYVVFTWDQWYEQLVEFQRGHGHCRVPRKWSGGLCSWITRMRKAYKDDVQRGRPCIALNDERIEKLNQLGFEWSALKTEPKSWDDRFEDLLKYKAEFGHTRVPLLYKANRTLANWVHHQRKAYKKKNPAIMGERAAKLMEVGFEFEDRQERNPTFEERVQQLTTYRALHGRFPDDEGDEGIVDGSLAYASAAPNGSSRECRVGVGENEEDNKSDKARRSLLAWVDRQRRMYRDMLAGRQTRLTKSRVKQLASIGFDWEKHMKRARSDKVSWDDRVAQLLEFKAQHGHANPPSTSKVGGWLGYIRQLHSVWKGHTKGNIPSTMTPERFALLEDIGVNLSVAPPRPSWEERYEQLLQFRAATGHCRVPHGWKENKGLASWVSEQRGLRKKRDAGKPCSLSDERVRLLDEIDFTWVAGVDRRKTYKGKQLVRSEDT